MTPPQPILHTTYISSISYTVTLHFTHPHPHLTHPHAGFIPRTANPTSRPHPRQTSSTRQLHQRANFINTQHKTGVARRLPLSTTTTQRRHCTRVWSHAPMVSRPDGVTPHCVTTHCDTTHRVTTHCDTTRRVTTHRDTSSPSRSSIVSRRIITCEPSWLTATTAGRSA